MIEYGGRLFTRADIDLICEVRDLCPGLSHQALVKTLCEHLDWVTASGTYKIDACGKLLDRLEQQGILRLPTKKTRGSYRRRTPVSGKTTDPPDNEINTSLDHLMPVSLKLVEKRNSGRFREYLHRYHYLGYKKPFGHRLGYWVQNQNDILGCILLSGSAKKTRPRDQWIGWSKRQQAHYHHLVINQSRFLLFPWVRVKNLASHVLGVLIRQVPADWEHAFGFRPVLVETFVDESLFQGTCYRAAGWTELGATTGRGLTRPGETYQSTPKRIFVKPLCSNFRQTLNRPIHDPNRRLADNKK